MRFTTKKLNLLVFTVSTLSFLVFFFYLIPKFSANPFQENIKLLDLRFWYTPIDVFHLFHQLGANGRDAYQFFTIYIDMLYPLVYGFWFYFSLTFLLKKLFLNNNKFICLRFIPFGIVLFDYIENLSILYLLNTFPQINEVSVFIGAIASSSKWIFTILTIITLIIAIFIVCAKFIGSLKIKTHKN